MVIPPARRLAGLRPSWRWLPTPRAPEAPDNRRPVRPVKKVNFGPQEFGGGYTWINDRSSSASAGPRGAQAGGRGDVMKVDAETNAESPLYDASKLGGAREAAGLTAADAARAVMCVAPSRATTGLA